MTPSFSAFNVQNAIASGTGVLGVTGKPVYLQGIFNTAASGQGLALFSGSAAATMAWVTLAGRTYTPFPMACPGGLTFQTVGNPGDATLGLTFFFIPGSNT